MTELTVIFVNYFTSELISSCIYSIDEKFNYEIIVVDNSNCENEKKVLKSILANNVKLIFAKKNLGFGKACNLAYKKSKGKYILLLNPDTKLFKNSILNLIKDIEQNKKIGAISPISFWDNNLQFLLPLQILPSPYWDILNMVSFRSFIVRYMVNKVLVKKNINSLEKLQYCSMLSGGHMLIRREAIEKIGYLFDEKFFMYYEDSDLSKRLRDSGYLLAITNSSKIVHYWEHSDSKYLLQKESKEYYYNKHYKFGVKILNIIERFIKFFPLKEPKDYISFDNINNFNEVNRYLNSIKNIEYIEFALHYTFIPSIIIRDNKIDFNIILKFLKNGEYWIRIVTKNKNIYIKIVLQR